MIAKKAKRHSKNGGVGRLTGRKNARNQSKNK
jgi:ribosomal protein L19E